VVRKIKRYNKFDLEDSINQTISSEYLNPKDKNSPLFLFVEGFDRENYEDYVKQWGGYNVGHVLSDDVDFNKINSFFLGDKNFSKLPARNGNEYGAHLFLYNVDVFGKLISPHAILTLEKIYDNYKDERAKTYLGEKERYDQSKILMFAHPDSNFYNVDNIGLTKRVHDLLENFVRIKV